MKKVKNYGCSRLVVCISPAPKLMRVQVVAAVTRGFFEDNSIVLLKKIFVWYKTMVVLSKIIIDIFLPFPLIR